MILHARDESGTSFHPQPQTMVIKEIKEEFDLYIGDLIITYGVYI